MAENKDLSNEEIALYDRQIRLWGLDAQKRIKTANILLVNLSAVGTEIAKDLVLGGIGSLSIIDDHDITERDLNAQFYISPENLGEKRVHSAKENIQDLNPRVKLQVYADSVTEKDEQWFSQFSLIITTELSKSENLRINDITRKLKVPFYATGLNGLFSYIFVDLIDHSATYKKSKSNVSTKLGKLYSFCEVVNVAVTIENDKSFENITTRDTFKSFRDFLQSLDTKTDSILETYTTRRKLKRISPILPLTLAAFDYTYNSKQHQEPQEQISTEDLEKNLEARAKLISENLSIPVTCLEGKGNIVKVFASQLNNEFAPVSAIVGGALAQDVINTLGKKGRPINNFVILDGMTGDMPIFTI